MALITDNLYRGDQLFFFGGRAYHRVHYATNDTAAQVETNGYFDAAATTFTEGVGDILDVVIDRDGTPALRQYLVTRTAGDIALTLSTATAAV